MKLSPTAVWRIKASPGPGLAKVTSSQVSNRDRQFGEFVDCAELTSFSV